MEPADGADRSQSVAARAAVTGPRWTATGDRAPEHPPAGARAAGPRSWRHLELIATFGSHEF